MHKAAHQNKGILTISEKKEIAMKIKSLPKENIIEIAQMVAEGPISESF